MAHLELVFLGSQASPLAWNRQSRLGVAKPLVCSCIHGCVLVCVCMLISGWDVSSLNGLPLSQNAIAAVASLY